MADAESRRAGLTTPPAASLGETRCHVLVLGAGPAGLVAAVGAAGLGAKVVLAEERLLGGDCLHTGCVPSKALIHQACLNDRSVRSEEHTSELQSH